MRSVELLPIPVSFFHEFKWLVALLSENTGYVSYEEYHWAMTLQGIIVSDADFVRLALLGDAAGLHQLHYETLAETLLESVG